MSSIGWEFYGIKFSVFITMLMAVVMALDIMLRGNKSSHPMHTDTMAGDEGDD